MCPIRTGRHGYYQFSVHRPIEHTSEPRNSFRKTHRIAKLISGSQRSRRNISQDVADLGDKFGPKRETCDRIVSRLNSLVGRSTFRRISNVFIREYCSPTHRLSLRNRLWDHMVFSTARPSIRRIRACGCLTRPY